MAGLGMTRRAAATVCVTLVAAVAGGGAAAAASSAASTEGGRLASGSALRALAARYLAIAQAGNRRLEDDFDPLEGRDRDNLRRSQADLRDAAATERLFDRRLLSIHFPPAIERVARHLNAINEKRATLTAAAAVAKTLALLRSYEPVLDAANGPVERDVATIRRQLGLPPPESS
jgi:hypothetical protein